MRVLVTGACGWIGREVCAYLQQKGNVVVGADLRETDGPWSRFQCLDVTKPLEFEASDIEAVIHCAGYAHRPNETPEEQKRFYAVNRDGTRNVLNWCERTGVERFLYVGSIASYDWNAADGNAVTEEHPMDLKTHYARSKHEGERLVVNSPLDWRVVRLATVFGEGDKANFSRMAQAMKRRLFPILGKGGARKSVLPVSLAAELIVGFAQMDDPPHRLINLSLPNAPALREITDAYHEVCGLPKCISIPLPWVKLMGLCGDLAAKVLGTFPFTSNTMGKLTTDTVVNVDRMLECFPSRTFVSFENYLRDCAEYYRRKGDGEF